MLIIFSEGIDKIKYKYEHDDKTCETRKMFSFLPLINNLITTRLIFLLLSISAAISSKTINILRFLFGFYSSIFLSMSSISTEYSIKALEL